MERIGNFMDWRVNYRSDVRTIERKENQASHDERATARIHFTPVQSALDHDRKRLIEESRVDSNANLRRRRDFRAGRERLS